MNIFLPYIYEYCGSLMKPIFTSFFTSKQQRASYIWFCNMTLLLKQLKKTKTLLFVTLQEPQQTFSHNFKILNLKRNFANFLEPVKSM